MVKERGQKWQKWSVKNYIENSILSSTNPIENRGSTQEVCPKYALLMHVENPSLFIVPVVEIKKKCIVMLLYRSNVDLESQKCLILVQRTLWWMYKKTSIIFFFVDIEISKTYSIDWRLTFKEHSASQNLSVFTNCCKSNESSISSHL